MNTSHYPLSRRQLFKSAAASAIALKLFPAALCAAGPPIKRIIPSSGEEISVMGLGSYITFDEKGDPAVKAELTKVLQLFFDNDGQLIDSSPMYGHAETALGTLLKDVDHNNRLFAATKVWTYGKEAGIRQMNESMQKMGLEVMDLMQIHNLRDWKVHMPTLREWKEQGKIRYIGITTSGGRDHDEFEKIMTDEPLDFVQFTYNIENRRAEKRLLPLAQDRGIATLINVPFGRGDLFKKVSGRQLPEWTADFDCTSWAQFFLKFLIANPQVSCVIPATSNPRHMVDNMGAGYGRLPDADTREKMAAYYRSL